MQRSDAIARLRSTRGVMRNQGVRALYLFGSVARNEAGENSDVDLFVGLITTGAASWSCYGPRRY